MGRILGFFDPRQEAGTAEVTALFVEPGCQGQGIGRALWEKLGARAAALGATQIGADSGPAAVSF